MPVESSESPCQCKKIGRQSSSSEYDVVVEADHGPGFLVYK